MKCIDCTIKLSQHVRNKTKCGEYHSHHRDHRKLWFLWFLWFLWNMSKTKNKRRSAGNSDFKIVNVKVSGDQWDGLRVVAVKRNEPVWQILQSAISRYLSESNRAR